jgi:hypothetical protein
MSAGLAAQPAAETFTATAELKAPGGVAASAPVTITIDRKMPQGEIDGLLKAFTSGGVQALRKALVGVPPTGSVKLGGGASTPTRLTLERPTEKGRLITIVVDEPLLFVGAGRPDAKPKAGFDFAIIDLEVDSAGRGSGMLAPAAKVTVKQGVFVVQDYASEPVRLAGISRSK